MNTKRTLISVSPSNCRCYAPPLNMFVEAHYDDKGELIWDQFLIDNIKALAEKNKVDLSHHAERDDNL